jgi:hypothetical protein
MAINSYSTLCDAVGRWLYRDDLTDTIPDFIALAESRINRDLRLRVMEKSATGTLNGATFDAPSDLGITQRMSIQADSREVELRYVSPENISKYSPATNLPQMYTLIGGQIKVIPAPDGAYVYTLYYMGDLPHLSSTQTTNWLILNAPDVYLFGSLLEAAPYLQDDARVPLWSQAYQQAVQSVQEVDDAARYPISSPLQMVAE